MLQYEIPSLHPVAVHFPIALLIAALCAAAVWLATGRGFWRRSTGLLLLAGSAGAAFAYLTGEAMLELSEDVPIVEELVDFHETLALATLILSIGLTIAFGLAEYRVRSRPEPSTDRWTGRAVGFAAVLALAVLVALAGHVGGVMVWGVAR